MNLSTLKSKFTLSNVLIVVVIILIVQNYLLVSKNSNLNNEIERLSYKLNSHSILKAGEEIAPFTATDLRNNKVEIIPGIDNKKILLLVFSTRCPACKLNFPKWKALIEKIKRQDISVIAISSESVVKLSQFVKTEGISYPAMSIEFDSTLAENNKWTTVPQTILIGKNKKIEKITGGVLSEKEINSFLSRI